MPISALLFGGRRASVVPLVFESKNWRHGTFLGTIVSSEGTAAANGPIGKLRHDPFAMLPFCGYHMGDYFSHWLSFEKRGDPSLLPTVYYVNWFLKDASVSFLWPGFRENGRVLKWIFERLDGTASAESTPIGNMPTPTSLDLNGLNLTKETVEKLLTVDVGAWLNEVEELKNYYKIFGEKFPSEIVKELHLLEAALVDKNPKLTESF